jgi:aspartyl-tRNA(Asn)/glutamyl-tRNA(Gln) amidotransferase subunit C
MTQISREDVLHLAQLSSLKLSDSEIDGLQSSIGDVIAYVEKLSKLDTTNVEPTYQVTGLQNVWRDDSVINYGVTREELLVRAPESIDNQIKVPKVL